CLGFGRGVLGFGLVGFGFGKSELREEVGVDVTELGGGLGASRVGDVAVVVVDVRATATAAATATRSCALATRSGSAGVSTGSGAVPACAVASCAGWWCVAAELGCVLGGEGQHALAREAGTLLDRVDVEDDRGDLVTLVEVLGDVFDVIVAQFADVNEALDAFFDLHEHAEVGDARDGAGDFGAWRVPVGQAAPRVGLRLAQAERDALLLRVDLEDHRVDGIAFVDDLLGVTHALGPAHLADVNEAFEAGFDLDERTERGEVGDG